MPDKFEKYLQLSNRLILVFAGFVVSMLLLLLGLRFLFGLLDSIPWFVYLFTLFIIIVPSAIFICLIAISVSRVKLHPKKGIRILAYTLNTLALLAWIYFLLADLVHFFKTGDAQINPYHSYAVINLAGSVALIFLLGIIQALSTEKEKDWMEKRKERLGGGNE